jgi:hypothetical protein
MKENLVKNIILKGDKGSFYIVQCTVIRKLCMCRYFCHIVKQSKLINFLIYPPMFFIIDSLNYPHYPHSYNASWSMEKALIDLISRKANWTFYCIVFYSQCSACMVCNQRRGKCCQKPPPRQNWELLLTLPAPFYGVPRCVPDSSSSGCMGL